MSLATATTATWVSLPEATSADSPASVTVVIDAPPPSMFEPVISTAVPWRPLFGVTASMTEASRYVHVTLLADSTAAPEVMV